MKWFRNLFSSVNNVASTEKAVLDETESWIEKIERYGTIPPTANMIRQFIEDYAHSTASTKETWHGREAGGLLLHSVRVAFHSLKFAPSLRDDPTWFNKIVITSFAHDLGKLIAYRVNGKSWLWNNKEIV